MKGEADRLHLRELGEHWVRLDPVDAEMLLRNHARHLLLRRVPGACLEWLICTGHYCGIIPLPSGRRLYIEPRAPVRNVWHLLGVARACEVAPVSAAGNSPGGLIDSLLAAFVTELEGLLARGLIGGYRRVLREQPTLRGRLDLQRQLRHFRGICTHFHCAYDEFGLQTAHNQVLAAAAEVAVRLTAAGTELRSRAAYCLRSLPPLNAGVTITDHLCLPPLTATSEHYRIPLMLASLLLDGARVSHRAGERNAPVFLVEMPRLFERFVCRTLGDGLPPNLVVRSDGHSVSLDEARRAVLRPDAVVEHLGRALCIVDAKYKPDAADRGGPCADDLYQMLAYGVGYGAGEAALVYPQPMDRRPLQIDRGGVRLTVHPIGIDLSGDLEVLSEQSAQLCAHVAEMAQASAMEAG